MWNLIFRFFNHGSNLIRSIFSAFYTFYKYFISKIVHIFVVPNFPNVPNFLIGRAHSCTKNKFDFERWVFSDAGADGKNRVTSLEHICLYKALMWSVKFSLMPQYVCRVKKFITFKLRTIMKQTYFTSIFFLGFNVHIYWQKPEVYLKKWQKFSRVRIRRAQKLHYW